MRYLLLAITPFFFFYGCEQKLKPNLDGEKLIKEKCSACHNLDLPPKTFEDEKAPPMMAVAFHVKDFIKVSNESDRIPKAIEFVKDYVLYPDAKKSFCDKKSLQTYGVMPSQKGNVSEDELQAIATYMFEHFTVKNLNEAQALQNKLNHMPKGEKLAIKYNCLGCHKPNKDLVGPSFAKIAKRYKNNPIQIKKSIEEGSIHKWDDSKNIPMPSFKDKISPEDIQILVKWIQKQ
ncbi:MAG: c-type cytochrome [Epsilonproteobacteria bacterium]|nr:c-type cytochrome [Campylobacterota bacterium]